MTIKQDRMSERIHVILSELLRLEVSDPSLQSITITQVKVDSEIMFARIYVNALGDESREQEVMAGLKRANGFLRREVGKRIRMRTVPELRFVWDKALAEADRVERLLNKLDIPESEASEDDFDMDALDAYDDYDGVDGEDGEV